jgi:hypothetical protein
MLDGWDNSGQRTADRVQRIEIRGWGSEVRGQNTAESMERAGDRVQRAADRGVDEYMRKSVLGFAKGYAGARMSRREYQIRNDSTELSEVRRTATRRMNNCMPTRAWAWHQTCERMKG